MKDVTAIFDIGKTNKKFFLFDDDFQEVHKEYICFDEIEDEDGYPTENLPELQKWLKSVFERILKHSKYNVKAINFSTYGASFVHLDENGEVLTPLYNYTKPIEQNVVSSFLDKYGAREDFLKTTGCFDLSMLNSGLQLYWLKYTKPDIFKKIKYSLHLPQYLILREILLEPLELRELLEQIVAPLQHLIRQLRLILVQPRLLYLTQIKLPELV